MAAFNPQTDDVNPQGAISSRSQGTGTNTALQSLFAGVGDTVTSGVQTADNYIQNKIEDNARYSFDAINNENGLDAGSIPAELTQSADGLRKLANAHIQGKVTQEHYYMQLASTLKGLRAKYPGYEKEVDDIVTKVTGTKPANAFRDQLFQNINNQEQLAKEGQNKTQQFIQSNMGEVQTLFPDYFSNPGKYAGQEQTIIAGVAKLKGNTYQLESQKALIGNNKELQTQTFNNEISHTASTLLTSFSNASGQNGSGFADILKAIPPGGLPEDKRNQLLGQLDQFEATARARLLQASADPAYGTMPADEKQKQIDAAMAPILSLKQMVSSNQYSEAAQVLARNSAQEQTVLSNLYNKDPNAGVAAAYAKMGSPELSQYFLQQAIANAGGLGNYVKATAVTDQVVPVAAGQDTMSNVLKRTSDNKEMTPADKNKAAGSQLDTFTGALKQAAPQQVHDMVLQNYTDKSSMFDSLSSETNSKGHSQYLVLFNKIFDPAITANIQKSGDQAASQQYADYAMDRFQGIPEFRKAAQDLGETVNFTKALSASFDPKTGQVSLQADPKQMASEGPMNSMDTRLHYQQAVKAKDAFNQALGVMKPIWAAAGEDPEKMTQTLLRNMNVDLSGPKQSGFFGWVNDQIDKNKELQDVGKIATGKSESSSGSQTGSLLSNLPSLDSVLQGGVGGFRENMQGQARYVPDENVGKEDLAFKLPPDSTADERSQVSPGKNWLVYDNKGIRNKPLSGRLVNSLSFLPDLGVTMKVFSGGQDEEGPNRTGSHRHDDGNAADVFFYKNGKKLDWADPNDRPLYEEIVRQAKKQGVTGFGAGPGYMQPGSMHLGFGKPAIWGASHSSDTAPAWLSQAYNSAD